jgi:hypothetical protein
MKYKNYRGIRRTSNYKGFERALDIDFKSYPPKSKRELSYQMMILKYHTKDNEKLKPTEKQLDYAWLYLKRKYPEQRSIGFYTKEKYKGHTIHRATTIIYHKNKVYRKGQFLPKRYWQDKLHEDD